MFLHASVERRRCWPLVRHHQVTRGRQHGCRLHESNQQGPASVQRIPPCRRPWALGPGGPGRRGFHAATGTPRPCFRLTGCTRTSPVLTGCIASPGRLRCARFTWLQEQRGDQRPQRHPHVKPHVPVARNVGDTVIQPCRWQEGSVLPPCSRILHFEYRF
ncbi:uncharacterized protein [Dermacentor albipictus]|uniref:uncharacterized protein isoform X3 n=1 Tax=Dermacentor albipictus TaxID=60249 RepID=UPI0031FD711C